MPEDDRLQRLSRELIFTAFTNRQGRSFEPWVLDRILGRLDEQEVHEGQAIFRKGDSPDFLYFMNEGRVQMVREGAPIWTYEGRWVLGTFDMLLDRPRDRTAIARTDMHLVKVRAEDWMDLIEDSFEVAQAAIRGAARGLMLLLNRVDEELKLPIHEPPPAAPLPPGPLNLVERALVLMNVGPLRGGGVQALTNIAAISKEAWLAEGELLAQPGQSRNWGTVVAEGEVVIIRRQSAAALRFGRGAFLGPSVALEHAGIEWDVRASRPTRVLKIPLEDWLDEMEEHHDMVRAALATLADQTGQLLDRIAARSGEIVLT
jgi:CRP-like cAMP-binding protein